MLVANKSIKPGNPNRPTIVIVKILTPTAIPKPVTAMFTKSIAAVPKAIFRITESTHLNCPVYTRYIKKQTPRVINKIGYIKFPPLVLVCRHT